MTLFFARCESIGKTCRSKPLDSVFLLRPPSSTLGIGDLLATKIAVLEHNAGTAVLSEKRSVCGDYGKSYAFLL